MCCILRVIETVGMRAYMALVAARTAATGNLQIRRLPFHQSQSVLHRISQNTVSQFAFRRLLVPIITCFHHKLIVLIVCHAPASTRLEIVPSRAVEMICGNVKLCVAIELRPYRLLLFCDTVVRNVSVVCSISWSLPCSGQISWWLCQKVILLAVQELIVTYSHSLCSTQSQFSFALNSLKGTLRCRLSHMFFVLV